MFARDYRALARDALRGKWKRTVLLVLLAMLLGAGILGGGVSFGSSSGVSIPEQDIEMLVGGEASREMITALLAVSVVTTVLSLWSFFMGSYVRVGLVRMLDNTLEGESPRPGMLFPRGIYGKCLGLAFLRSLFVLLWSMLLVVPGIIAGYRYSMADYILYKNPEMKAMDALRESKMRMQGRKWRLFCLEFSFIGWELLCTVPLWITTVIGSVIVIAESGFNTPASTEGMMLLGGMIIIGALLSFIASIFATTYLNTAVVAFFREADRAGTWREEARAGEEYAREAYGDHAGPTIATALPHLEDAAPVESVLSTDETVARDVFMQHKCSRCLLEKAGLLEEYQQLKASPIAEARWKKDYSDRLMRRFDQDPSALDDILALAAEYGMDDLTNRALQRIERHLRQETLNDAEILNMCGRVLALLVSGSFAENPGFIDRKKEQISDMIDRLELRLRSNDPDGAWQQDLALIRRMCS